MAKNNSDNKRKVMDVDEKYLQELMAAPYKPDAKAVEKQPEIPKPNIPLDSNKENKKDEDKIQNSIIKYFNSFLVSKDARVYVATTYRFNPENIKRIRFLLQASDSKLSISEYINNILSNHLHKYKDEISEIIHRSLNS